MSRARRELISDRIFAAGCERTHVAQDYVVRGYAIRRDEEKEVRVRCSVNIPDLAPGEELQVAQVAIDESDGAHSGTVRLQVRGLSQVVFIRSNLGKFVVHVQNRQVSKYSGEFGESTIKLVCQPYKTNLGSSASFYLHAISCRV